MLFLILLTITLFANQKTIAETYTLGVGNPIVCTGNIYNDQKLVTTCTVIIPSNVPFSSVTVNIIIIIILF